MARFMSARQRRFWWAAAIVLGAGAGMSLAYFVATSTTFGRSWLLSALVTRANKVFGGRGSLRIGVLREISPGHIVAEQVSLVDTAGVPVVTAERLDGTLNVSGLWNKAIHIKRLHVRGLVLDLKQDTTGRPWNIAYIISGQKKTGVKSGPGFGDDVRIDSVIVDRGRVAMLGPWAPHPMFTGRVRDSVIAMRDSLHDIVKGGNGLYFQRRVASLDLVRAHDLIVVDVKKRPASLILDSLAGVLSDPPVPIRHAAGRLYWTSDSLRLDLNRVVLPASQGSAVGTVAWNQPGPVRYDVVVKADAGLADLGWIWDVLPREGRGTATVHMRTLADANDAEYLLENMDVGSGTSRIRGNIAVTVRPADLLLHRVDLTFTPLRSELLRRISYEALPPEINGTFTGRLVAMEGGPLTSMKLDLLDARFTDDAVKGGAPALSSAKLRGMVSLGARPRAWGLAVSDVRVDLRSVRALAPTAPPVDGLVTGALTVRTGDLTSADLTGIGLTWTDGAGHVSTVRGDARVRVGDFPTELHATLALDPISMRALARVDSTLPLRADVAGRVTLDGRMDALQWTGRVWAVTGADSGSSVSDTLRVRGGGLLSLAGSASLGTHQWSGTAEGSLAGFDLRTWMGRDDVPHTALHGTVRLAGRGPLDTLPVPAGDTSRVAAFEGGGDLAIRQTAADDRPAFDLLGSATLGRTRLVVDSATMHIGGMTLEARGALARDSLPVDTLQISVRADTLEQVRAQLGRLAAMMQPVDSSIATRLRRIAADTLRGDFSLSGYLYGGLRDADATAALGAQDVQVGAVHVGRIFGSARAQHVFSRPAFEGTANADMLTGLGVAKIQTATFRVENASPDSGLLVLDVSSESDAHLVARGRYAAKGARTNVVVDSLQLTYDKAVWRSERALVLETDSAGLVVQPLELRSNQGGVLAIDANVPANGAVQGTLRVVRFPVGEVSALLAGTTPFDGTLTGSATLGGSRQAPVIGWSFSGDSLGVDGYYLPPLTSTGSYADRRLLARAEMKDSAGGTLRAEGRLPMDLTIGTVEKRLLSDVVEGEVVADSLRLQALPLSFAGIRRPRGVLSGRLSVGGTVDRPVAQGTMRLDGASAYFEDLGIEPVDGRLVLRAQADSLVLESLALRSGGVGDTLSARGVLHFPSGTPATVDLFVAANNFEASRQRDGTDLDISGRMEMHGPLKRPVVSGSLFVPMANLVVDPLGARTALDLSSDAARALLGADEVPVAETAAQSLAALGRFLTVENARVDLGNAVWVVTPESKVKLAGGLSVAMSGERLALEGEITAQRGQYRLDLGVVNRSFSVDSGRVRFYGNDAIAPTLDISATNVVRVAGGSEIPVRVHIGGTYDAPVLTLSSSDPLYASAPESEIISLLIFGAPTFALDGQSQSTVRAVTGVLLPSVGGAVEGALQRLLPVFNTVQVSTAGGQTQNDLSAFSLLDNLSITAGKQLNDRTFLRLNTGVCRGAGQANTRGSSLWYGIAAEYRIARGLSGQVGVDPGSAPCTRLGSDVLPRMQFGFDLFREWIF
jgi:translocation and assembly module TamB